MSAPVRDKRLQTVFLCCAGAFLLLGAWLLFSTSRGGELSKITAMLAQYGYTVPEDALYIAGDYRNTSIQELLTDVDLEAAVAASRAAGFPSDITRRGDVVLILAASREEEIVTLYALDGEMELCFVQRPNEHTVKALGAAS